MQIPHWATCRLLSSTSKLTLVRFPAIGSPALELQEFTAPLPVTTRSPSMPKSKPQCRNRTEARLPPMRPFLTRLQT